MSTRTYADGQLVKEWDDATRTYRQYEGGSPVEERPYTEDEAARLVEAETVAVRDLTRRDLLGRVDAALTANLAYLALNPPTTAQAVAQVERLTRQVVALLRLVGGRLDDTAGT